MAYDNETGDSYVPPSPPPIHINDPINAIALIGVIGAPLLFVLVGVLAEFQTTFLSFFCTFIFVVSFVTLVARAKTRPRPDDGWDDGAVL